MIPPGTRAERPLVILGPTASGKSSLALALADLVEGAEIVSVDSMQVYKGMDIGTATPTAAEQEAVRHHLINLVEPTVAFTAGEFQRRTREVLADITWRGGVPILVGGTGLYLRAVIDDLDIPGQFPEVRGELEGCADTEDLHRQLVAADPVAAARMEPSNRRRIVRALEVTIGSGRPFSSFGPGLETYPPNRFVQVAIRRPRSEVDSRIVARYHTQIEQGFLEEVASLAETGLGPTARQALGYRELLEHLEGRCTIEEALDQAIRRTIRFARRQERWFRRDPRLHWVEAPVDPADVLGIWDRVRATHT